MSPKRWCNICGEEFFGENTRCSTCWKAMTSCDRPTYDLVVGLLKRIELLESRIGVSMGQVRRSEGS